VTKWVHLNWGDDGLITLFSKIWRLLQPVTILYLIMCPLFAFHMRNWRLALLFRVVSL